MATCQECGTAYVDGTRFCAGCGTPVPPPPATPEPAPSPPPARPVEAEPARGPEPTAPTSDPRWKRARIAGIALLLVSLLGAGLVTGWFVGADHQTEEAAKKADFPAPARASTAARSMPDLRGINVQDARQVLADLGVPASSVTVTEQPAAGEVGVVLTQDPVFGYEVDGAVRLEVSQQARVPQIDGRDATTVLADLAKLGAQTKTVSRFVPDAVVGAVASIRPAPGTVLPDLVRVVIATAPGELDLTTLPAVQDECYVGEDAMNTKTYPNLLTCDAYAGEPVEQSWVIGRRAQKVTGLLGVPDDADAGAQARLEVLVDGQPVGVQVTAGYGETTPFEATVADGFRLTLRVTSDSDEGDSAGIADLTLVGDPSAIKALEPAE